MLPNTRFITTFKNISGIKINVTSAFYQADSEINTIRSLYLHMYIQFYCIPLLKQPISIQNIFNYTQHIIHTINVISYSVVLKGKYTLFVWLGFIPGPRTSNGTLISNSYSCRLSIGKENWPINIKSRNYITIFKKFWSRIFISSEIGLQTTILNENFWRAYMII